MEAIATVNENNRQPLERLTSVDELDIIRAENERLKKENARLGSFLEAMSNAKNKGSLVNIEFPTGVFWELLLVAKRIERLLIDRSLK